MRISNIEVYGFRAAIRGMRNPRNSHGISDSEFGRLRPGDVGTWETIGIGAPECPEIGKDDLRLMLSLIKRGCSHRKFLRMIQVWCDMTLPRFVWVDLDTYKVGTVKNCQSSAFVLGSRELRGEDFQGGIDARVLWVLNELSAQYRANKTAENLHLLKSHLPESFLQTATYSFNYETALAIYRDRKTHVLPEFSGPRGICEMIQRLPYMLSFIKATLRE